MIESKEWIPKVGDVVEYEVAAEPHVGLTAEDQPPEWAIAPDRFELVRWDGSLS